MAVESPGWWQKTGFFVQSGKNRMDFAMRNFMGRQLRKRKKRYSETPEDHATMFATKAESAEWEQHEKALLMQYELAELKSHTTTQRYLENLSIVHHLEYMIQRSKTPVVEGEQRQTLSLLDVGSKNWSYVNALAAYFGRWDKNVILDGIELDPYRRYTDGFCRADYARHYSENILNANYHEGDVMTLSAPYDVVTCFLPFVFEEPCLAWGLPLDYFNPQAFFDHLLTLLKPGGILLIVNQGNDEYRAQRGLISHSAHNDGIVARGIGKLPETFYPYEHPRYGWVIQREK